MVLSRFGDGANLQLQYRPIPDRIGDDEILVRVHATSVNPIEWKMRQGLGLPHWLWRRALGSPMVLGLDFSGTVVRVGAEAQDYEVGDEVMGAMPFGGADSDYLVVRPNDPRTALARKPAWIEHEKAALVPFAGLVAYAGLMTYGGLHEPARGARVLIVGASGGVGHLAVQMAKYCLGAELVVGVCSSRNADFVRDCGADDVIAHDHVAIEDIAGQHKNWHGRFDLIFDAVGIDRYFSDVAPHLLRTEGRFVTAAIPATTEGRPGEDVALHEALPLVTRMAKRHLCGRYRLIPGLLGGLPSKTGFPDIVRWMDRGLLEARTAATYDLADLPAAHLESQGGRTVGKIAIRLV